MIVTAEKDCSKSSIVKPENPERCLCCRGFINYRMGL